MKVEKRYLSLPLTAQLEITDFCNHRCIHCYNLDSAVENRPMRKVSDETVLACAQKLIDNQIFNVIVTGGEPLIKKELTQKVIRLLKENRIRVSLNSNLTLADDDFIQFLKEQQVGVLTSCPSGESCSFSRLTGTDNYPLFETNIRKLVSAGVRFTINMVVTKENLHEVRTTAEKMHELGCKSFAATPMGLNVEYPRLDLLLSMEEVRGVIADLLWIEEYLKMKGDILEALPKCVFPESVLKGMHAFLNRKCQAGRTVIAVSCSGDVRPCAHNPYSYGNLLEEELRNIWQKMSDWRSLQYIPEECMDCAWLNRCNGGCRTSAKVYSGDWNKKDIWCTGKLTTPLSDNTPKNIELKPETRLQFSSEIRVRKEDDEAYVVYNVEDDVFFMVNYAYYDFIMDLKKQGSFSFGELCQTNHFSPDSPQIQDAIAFLIKKKVLKIIDKNLN
ncbi:MAG: radical SAM protein [Bacteroidales bacterium]|nr:radical SAM protein [Bacteroidales bacterium]